MGMSLLMGINVDEASCFVKVLLADGLLVSNTQPLLELRPCPGQDLSTQSTATLQQKLPQFLAKNSTLQPFEHKPKQNNTTPKVHIFQPPSNSCKTYPKMFFQQHFTQKFRKKLEKIAKTSPNPPTSHPPRLLNKRAIRARRVKRKRRMRRKPPNVSSGEDFWGTNNLVVRSGLVGGFNPSEKYDRQIGSFPQTFGVKMTKNI